MHYVLYNWIVCKYINMTHSSMQSHEKSMSSRDIYHYIVYIYLVCVYCLDSGTLRKCIVQDPSTNQKSI